MYFTLSPLIYIIDCSYIYACTKSFDLTGVKKKKFMCGINILCDTYNTYIVLAI